MPDLKPPIRVIQALKWPEHDLMCLRACLIPVTLRHRHLYGKNCPSELLSLEGLDLHSGFERGFASYRHCFHVAKIAANPVAANSSVQSCSVDTEESREGERARRRVRQERGSRRFARHVPETQGTRLAQTWPESQQETARRLREGNLVHTRAILKSGFIKP
jgi:hypothetical protein